MKERGRHMEQFKFYQYDPKKVHRESLENTFSSLALYFFSDLQNVVGISFDFDKNNLKKVTEQASELGLKPAMVTRYKFLKLMENITKNERKILNLEFTSDIDEEVKNELDWYLTQNSLEYNFFTFIEEILTDNNYIKCLSWYEGNEYPVKLSMYDKGILFINDGKEALEGSDSILSSVFN